jgi:hypothetical protein
MTIYDVILMKAEVAGGWWLVAGCCVPFGTISMATPIGCSHGKKNVASATPQPATSH